MSQPQRIGPDQVGRMSQIIVGALIMGLVSFGVVAYIVGQGKASRLNIISYIGLAFFAINSVVSLVLTRSMTAKNISQIAAEPPSDWRPALSPIYMTRNILSIAPLEGAGFFNCLAYIIDGHWLSLAIVFAIVSLMAITFPSQAQFEAWAEQVQRDHSS